MKKYMKPVMESEVFVANEYVSACYYVECTEDGCSTEIGDEGYLKDTELNNVLHTGHYKVNEHSCAWEAAYFSYFHVWKKSGDYNYCHKVSITECGEGKSGKPGEKPNHS